MAIGKNTKRMFADELEVMMQRIPLSKVRIAELCIRCGVERRVFYYHFKDKYDLVAWMFEQDQLEASEVAEPYTQKYYEEAHVRLWNRREFYRRAFEEDTQNSIHKYLLEYSIDANEAALRLYLGVPKLATKHAFEARHFAHGNVGCVVDWLQGKIEASPAQLATHIFSCIPSTLGKAYEARIGSDVSA